MRTGKGTPVFNGVAIGKARCFVRKTAEIPEFASDAAAELARFNAARDQARADLDAIYDKTLEELGEEQAAIIDIQRMLLDDLDFVEGVEASINEGHDAAWAARSVGSEQAEMFASLDDEYMKARATDIRDMATRLVGVLTGSSGAFVLDEPAILVADDLAPSETVQLDKSKIIAFVTQGGSTNSHTAILARVMSIPSIVQADIPADGSIDGELMIVDGATGEFWIDPDCATITNFQAKKACEECERAELEKWRGRPTVTKSGRKVKLFANIGSPDDIKYVIDGDAEGIGLLRSEFLYLGRGDYPGEDELYGKYKTIIDAMEGKRVVIRTLDIGADKQVGYFDLAHEENPALGLRGIRICIERPEIFRTQMRAILRASAHGPVSVMFPMIASEWEVAEVKDFTAKIKAELDSEGIAYGKDLELGIMVETPAAAVMADVLARQVDFFSVGTNDLTQYTLAADRQNAAIGRFCDTRHPALMRLLAFVAKSAREAGIWCGICGELGADPELTETFIEMGYDELSVSPPRVLELRKRICESEV